MSRTPSRALTGLALTALAAILMTAASSSAGPGYTQPKTGSCHRLTMHQAVSAEFMTAASVDCGKPHTGKSLIVKRFKGKVDWSEPTWTGIYQSCARKTVRALGSDKARAMSAYELTFFAPLAKDRKRGATWRRCDVTLLGGKKLLTLPDRLHLTLPVPDRYARCLAGPERRLTVTVCAKPHTYRATGAFHAPGAKFPGLERLHQTAQRRCPKLVSSRVYRYDFPDRAVEWSGGWRTVICYSKTKQ